MKEFPIPIGFETVFLDSGSVEYPLFSDLELEFFQCARYARLASFYMFDKKFPISAAWGMAKQDGVFSQPIYGDELRGLSKEQLINPGALIGIYNPESFYLASVRPYTHMGVFLGLIDGEPVILEQHIDKVQVSSLDDLANSKFLVREILDLVPLELSTDALRDFSA